MTVSQGCTTAIDHLYVPEIIMEDTSVEDSFQNLVEDILDGRFAPRLRQSGESIRLSEPEPDSPEEFSFNSDPIYTMPDWINREHLPDDKEISGDFVTINIRGTEILIDPLAAKNTIPPATFEFGDLLGPNNNPWTFWFKLSGFERRQFYHYTPIYIPTYCNLEIKDEFLQEFGIEHAEQTLNVIFYPFGLFSIRLKTTFRAEESLSAEELVRFRRGVIYNTTMGYTRGPLEGQLAGTGRLDVEFDQYDKPFSVIFRTIREEILQTIFALNVPDYHEVRSPDISPYHLTYLYKTSGLSQEQIAKIVADETRSLSSDFIDYKTNHRLGKLEGDRLYFDASGGIISTPGYNDISKRNRRKVRIAIMNNAYLGVDFGMFEQNHLPELDTELRDVVQKVVDGTRVGAPMNGKGVASIVDLLDLPEDFRGLRYQIYRQISPRERRQTYEERYDSLVSLLVKHESDLGKALQSLPGVSII